MSSRASTDGSETNGDAHGRRSPRRADASIAPTDDGPILTRRTVLAAGIGAFVGAATGIKPPIASAAKARQPTLWPAQADVWARSIDVEGTPPNAELSVNGQPVPTSPGSRAFTATVPLSPAENVVTASHSGAGTPIHRSYLARVEDRPTARVVLNVAAGAVHLDASASEPDPYSGAPIVSVSWRLRDGTALGSGSMVALRGPWTDGEQYVVAEVTDTNGRSDETTVVFEASGGQPALVDMQSWQAEWVQSAVVYGAVPPLFGQPPLQALTGQLDRLAALGVNVLWLSPVFATTPGEFGYAVTDYFSVRPDYGDLASLQALVGAAHARGIKVILDLPLNDTSDRHPYYLQSKQDTTGSHYWGFYERNAAGKALHYFNWKHLPNLDYDSAEVRQMAIAVASYWLRAANVDGFRCDAAWGVQERRPGFWSQWRAELQRIRPDLLLLAEGSARESLWSATGFAAAYDWTDQLGQWAWEGAFAPKTQSAPALRKILEETPGSRPFRFLDNNDTGARFISRNGPDLTRAASALLLSLPGIPCIYAGEEIGASYEPYQRTEPLNWASDPNELESFYRSLIEERLANPALAVGSLALVDVTPAERVLAYILTLSGVSTLVAINFSSVGADAVITTGDGELNLQVPAWSRVTMPAT